MAIYAGSSRASLYAACGRPREMLVLVENEGEKYVAKGGTFAYHEWWGGSGDRTDDGQWREMLRSGSAPPPPKFTKAFMPR